MRRVLVACAAAVVVAALASVGAAWAREPEPVSEERALDLAAEAFASAGVDAAVGRGADRGTYEADDGSAVEVWQTTATVDERDVVLWVSRERGEPVYLDDRGDSGAVQVLTDDQFEALAAFDPTTPDDELRRENLAVTVAASVVALAAASLVLVARRSQDL